MRMMTPEQAKELREVTAVEIAQIAATLLGSVPDFEEESLREAVEAAINLILIAAEMKRGK